MFNFSVDVFVTNPHSLQAHLRRHTGPAEATKPDAKPFALLNAHFTPAPDHKAEAMILIYDETVFPQAMLGELAPGIHNIIKQNMGKEVAGILALKVLDKSLTAQGDPPKGFAINRTMHTEVSDRYILVEAAEGGPVPNAQPSAVIDVFFAGADQLSVTLLTLDQRLYGEQAARGLLGWFVQQMKIEARQKTGVEWHNAQYIGFARPQPVPGAGGASGAAPKNA
jgi:hypothetical protein